MLPGFYHHIQYGKQFSHAGNDGVQDTLQCVELCFDRDSDGRNAGVPAMHSGPLAQRP
jgi:hypothetical protein